MNNRTKLIAGLIVTLSIGLVVGSIFFARHQKAQQILAEAAFTKIRNADAHTYTDLEGNDVSLKQYEGKRLLVLAWASWCPQCDEQLTTLSRVAKEVNTSLPLLVINRKESVETAGGYLEVMGKKEGLVYILDTQDHFFKTSGGFAMPEIIVYSPDGTEEAHIRGTATEDELRTVLSQYKKE